GRHLPFSRTSGSSDATSTASQSTHTVVSGATLGRTAAQHGTSVSALMSENGLSSPLIYPGDKLTIPGSTSAAGSASSASSSTASPGSSSSASNATTSTASSSSSNGSESTTSQAATQTAGTSASTSGASWAIGTANSASSSYRLGANGEGNQWDCSSFTQQA